MVKKAKKKTSRKSRGRDSGGGDILFTKTAIVISLSAADQRRAQQCLKKTGKITFSVKETAATKLPDMLDNGKLID